MDKVLQKIERGAELERDDLRRMLALESAEELQRLYAAAYEVKKKYVGTKVYLRGLVEIGNLCSKNCYYCGIRRDNQNVNRFMLSREEIIEGLELSWQYGYGSAVLQGGERDDSDYIDFIESVLTEAKQRTNGELGITLSLGEQSRQTYERWFKAGAHRYLLRIETSNRELYGKLHPADHSFDARLKCLQLLRETGYQVGTGVMQGLPFQTIDDLVNDLMFFKEFDIDMIGMGPYLVHHDTPLAKLMPDFEQRKPGQLELGLKMIAATRILLKDVNIASTTALQALGSHGRESGLLAGANVLMPNVTPTAYRPAYLLYDGKPGTNENSEESRVSLEKSIHAIGETVGNKEWGDSPHFQRRTAQ